MKKVYIHTESFLVVPRVALLVDGLERQDLRARMKLGSHRPDSAREQAPKGSLLATESMRRNSQSQKVNLPPN